MKKSTLRNAITSVLFVMAAGPAALALAQETEADKPIGSTHQVQVGEPEIDLVRAPSRTTASQEASTPTDLASVTVTGTRIRGGSTPSPVITFGSERIQTEGFTSLGEVIRSVPQNFRGGQNPGVVGAASNVANQDFTGGSSLNLRGLGPDASLTLLNGRRLAYDGSSQAVDISAIPVEAVERLDIIPDGASAIYGSDAVGGVANVILKRDFEGVALGVRHGGATEGGLGTREYTATAGTTWPSGGMIATFKEVSTDPIHARQRDYTRHLVEPYTIYGGSDARSGLASVHQSVGDVAELRLDALRTKRNVTRYDFYLQTPETTITLVSPGMTFFLRNDWSLTLGGAYGKNENIYENRLVSGADIRLVTQTCYCNESSSYEIGAEGPLFAVGGGDARLAVGAGSRRDEFMYRPKVSGRPYDGDERSRFAYAELNLPLVSPSSAIAGIHGLAVSAAARGEDYDSFGRVITPKLGVIYDPSPDVTLKASWGRSFKAPTLVQRHRDKVAYLWSAATVGASGMPADATVLMSYGGNPDLEAERARTWTASLALHPQALPGFEAELTWFDIDYVDRVLEPVNYLQALSNSAYAEFVDRAPTRAQIDGVFEVFNSAFFNLSGGAYDPDKVVAIIRNQYVNVARQRIKGLDLSGAYRFDVGSGGLTVRGSASWLDSVQRTSPGQPEQALAGTIFHPAKLNSRLGAMWTSGGFTAAGFANYTSGVTNRLAATTEKTASFTTLDTTMSYELGGRAAALSGLSLGLSVQNLLNREPPQHTAAAALATFVPYDATNYSAIGRFVSVSVSKHW